VTREVKENAHSPAVISSPHLGVFAVNAAGPGLRRGHVIYSGVFAVAAVAAVVVGGEPAVVAPVVAEDDVGEPGLCSCGSRDGESLAGYPPRPGGVRVVAAFEAQLGSFSRRVPQQAVDDGHEGGDLVRCEANAPTAAQTPTAVPR